MINQVSINAHPLSNVLSIEPHEGSHSPMKVIKLPPSTKSDLKKDVNLIGKWHNAIAEKDAFGLVMQIEKLVESDHLL